MQISPALRFSSRLFDLANAVWCCVDVGSRGGSVAPQRRRIRLMYGAYGWADPGTIIDEIHADLRRALANHKRAGRQDHWLTRAVSKSRSIG